MANIWFEADTKVEDTLKNGISDFPGLKNTRSLGHGCPDQTECQYPFLLCEELSDTFEILLFGTSSFCFSICSFFITTVVNELFLALQSMGWLYCFGEN